MTVEKYKVIASSLFRRHKSLQTRNCEDKPVQRSRLIITKSQGNCREGVANQRSKEVQGFDHSIQGPPTELVHF